MSRETFEFYQNAGHHLARIRGQDPTEMVKKKDSAGWVLGKAQLQSVYAEELKRLDEQLEALNRARQARSSPPESDQPDEGQP